MAPHTRFLTVPVEFSARVVDIACTLKNDCPPDCGGGKRLLGLMTEDGKLRAAVKAGEERIVRKGNKVEVFGSLIRSHITPETTEVSRENTGFCSLTAHSPPLTITSEIATTPT